MDGYEHGTEAYYATVALLIPTLTILLLIEIRGFPVIWRFLVSYQSHRVKALPVILCVLLAGTSGILAVFMIAVVPNGEIHALKALYRGRSTSYDGNRTVLSLILLSIQIVLVTVMRFLTPWIERLPIYQEGKAIFDELSPTKGTDGS